MPPTLGDRLAHILAAAETIQAILTNKTREEFANDVQSRLAVERALEIICEASRIICEASRHIPDAVKAQRKDIDWPRMVGFGNLLRHAYHSVDPQIVFDIVENDLPPLTGFAERVLREQDR